MAQRDLSEDAEGYSAIGLYEIIQIAVQTGKVDQLKDPGVKKMFDRYRDQLSTFGAMPMYGDDYFGEAWELWTYNFEYARRLYNDPTYLDAAQRNFWFGSRNFPRTSVNAGSDAQNLLGFYYFAQVASLSQTDLQPVVTSAQSEVATRNSPPPGTSNTPDKLILAPSRSSGDPYAMVELYGLGAGQAADHWD